MKETFAKILDTLKPTLVSLNDYMYAHPEGGDQEFLAMEKLTSTLRTHGFQVETGLVGRPTAFKGVFDSGKPGPTVAFLAEYDALPEIGHGCGHNMIGTMALGAGIALSQVLSQTGGQVLVLGTPAEETNGAKVAMAKEGIFDQVDAALILHPSQESSQSGRSLAMDALEFAYTGKASHAAAQPEKGINALDSVIQLFNGINALRQHVPSDVRIHGIIAKGGVAANIVPDYAVAQFYIRAAERSVVDEVGEKVKKIAEGAALMTGATLAIANYELSYDNMRTNETLSHCFTQNLLAMGEEKVSPAKEDLGSIDMGNVSHVVPAIHPYIGFGCPQAASHSKEFADGTVTDEAHEALLRGAGALALTGYDLLTHPSLLDQVKKEFSGK